MPARAVFSFVRGPILGLLRFVYQHPLDGFLYIRRASAFLFGLLKRGSHGQFFYSAIHGWQPKRADKRDLAVLAAGADDRRPLALFVSRRWPQRLGFMADKPRRKASILTGKSKYAYSPLFILFHPCRPALWADGTALPIVWLSFGGIR